MDLTFGLRDNSLEEVATAIQRSFSYVFLPRYSSFLGGEYYRSENSAEEVVVQLNKDGDELAEADFPDCGVLVLVDGCQDLDCWRKLVDELGGVMIRQNYN